MSKYTERLKTFTEDNLPDLDEVVLGALELFAETELPEIDFSQFKRPLVVGSVNGAAAGELLFTDRNAVFADESDYIQKLTTTSDIDGAFLISASGSKHAISISQELKTRNIETILITNNPTAPASEFISNENINVFPRNREPYTYNTSTYMSMLLSKTKEDPAKIYEYIENTVKPLIPNNLTDFKAFCLVIPPEYNAMAAMIRTKFDELFGPEVVGRVFTTEQMKHAKTVVDSKNECFVTFGNPENDFGHDGSRINIPLPDNHDLVAMLAIGYFFVGHIQKQFPPFFKNDITNYVKSASEIFGSDINVIVE